MFLATSPRVWARISRTLTQPPSFSALTPLARREGTLARRIALYSHDTMGLGHMRRNLLIAQSLVASVPGVSVLLVCGSHQATAFAMPPGVDCLTLPALRKEPDGCYDARSLALSLAEISDLRRRMLRATIEAFRPDLLVVDNVPRGALRELDPALEAQRAGGRRCVLGLRDVLDDPAVVWDEWRRACNEEAIRDYYDEVWVYGDPRVYDLARECAFPPAIAERLRYLGYLDQKRRLAGAAPVDGRFARAAGPFALCSVGGGQDGLPLAEAFARAEAPAGVDRVLLVGPAMAAADRAGLGRQSARDRTLTVLDFVREPTPLVQAAGCVVGMGGYNTICEALSFGKRALIVPRVRPRREQLIRAERMARLGLLDMLPPDSVTPEAISAWLGRNFGARASARVDLDGLTRVPMRARRLLARDTAREGAGSGRHAL